MSTSPLPSVLLVDDLAGNDLGDALERCGFRVEQLGSGEDALARLELGRFAVCVARLAARDRLGFAARHAQRFPDIPLIGVADAPSDSDGLAERRAGFDDHLSSPVDPAALELSLTRALASHHDRATLSPVVPALAEGELLGESAPMQKLRKLIEQVAERDAPVLVRGETGTGKELVVRAIHRQSRRAGAPLVKADVAGFSDELMQSELFGHERGAFTTALTRRYGKVQLAEHGTLFLDELGEATPAVQAKLLRLTQDKQYERMGGTSTLVADVRFVAATHRDLPAMVKAETFRADLWYRLEALQLWVPPLRARRDDIPLLAKAFLAALVREGRELAFDAAALGALRAQRWPGNVRQLQNLVVRLETFHAGSIIHAEDVLANYEAQVQFATQATTATSHSRAGGAWTSEPAAIVSLSVEVAKAERAAIVKALRATNGNRTKAAQLLGISRRTLHAKLDEHSIEEV